MKNKKVKVVYIIGSLRPGGAERHLVELVKTLDKELFEPIIYCLSEKGDLAKEIEKKGILVRDFDLKNKRSKILHLKELMKLISIMSKRLKEDKPKIVHTYLFWANILGGISAKMAGIQYLITSRRSLGLYKNGRKMMQVIENVMNIFTDVVTVNSKEVLNDTLNREKFIKGKIKLLYNGVDSKRFKKNNDTTKLKEMLNIPTEDIVITNVSNLIHYKGHFDFIEASRIMMRQHPEVTILLVGRDGGMQGLLQEKVKEYGLDDKIRFLGSRGDIVELLSITNIQVLSSHEEGFSNAILEGMACSLPLVVTDVGGNSEAVLDGINGFVVPAKSPRTLADALIKLLNNKSILESFGIESRKRIENYFTIEMMKESYEKMYIELIK